MVFVSVSQSEFRCPACIKITPGICYDANSWVSPRPTQPESCRGVLQGSPAGDLKLVGREHIMVCMTMVADPGEGAQPDSGNFCLLGADSLWSTDKTNLMASHCNPLPLLASDFENSDFFTKGSEQVCLFHGLEIRDKAGTRVRQAGMHGASCQVPTLHSNYLTRECALP